MEEIKLWKIITQQGAKPKASPVENVTETTTVAAAWKGKIEKQAKAEAAEAGAT